MRCCASDTNSENIKMAKQNEPPLCRALHQGRLKIQGILRRFGEYPSYDYVKKSAVAHRKFFWDKDSKAVFKEYSMIPWGEKTSLGMMLQLESARRHINGQLDQGTLRPYSGLGFFISSENYINVVRWDGGTAYEDPMLMHNQVYSVSVDGGEDPAVPVFSFIPIKNMDDGAYCGWEVGIANHEREAWRRFLESKRTVEDKLKYLEDQKSGLI